MIYGGGARLAAGWFYVVKAGDTFARAGSALTGTA